VTDKLTLSILVETWTNKYNQYKISSIQHFNSNAAQSRHSSKILGQKTSA